MAKWNYTLRCGRALKAAIEAEDSAEIINQLRCAYRELADKGMIDEEDYLRYTEDFDSLEQDMWEEDSADYAEEAEDEINWELDQFYDLCDNIGVWVAL